MNPDNYIFKVSDLTYVFGKDTPYETVALDNVSLNIEYNDYLAIIGQTGSGKSTFVQHLNALNKPNGGKLLFKDKDIWEKNYDRHELRSHVGLVFQYPEYQLFEETVKKDIAYGPKNMGLSDEEIDERVNEALKFVGLDEDILERSPFEISGGQKRRVAIAGVISMKPEVLVLDEPTAGLDPRGRDDIMNGIYQYHQTTGAAIVIVSHSMEDVTAFAKHVAVFGNGRLLKYGDTNEIFSHPEILIENGLDVPQITKILFELNKSGYNFDTTIFSVEKAAETFIDYLSDKGKI